VKKVILDENLPQPLRHHLTEFDVVTVQFLGWSGIQNGELISLIDGRFDVFLTSDQNLRYQQNLSHRQIAIVELPFIRRKEIPRFVDQIRKAILSSNSGDYIRITLRPED
jgi:predicted metalloenzyme YecM